METSISRSVFSGPWRAFRLAASDAGACRPTKDPINPPPTLQDWQALAKLPDWSGVWTPVISDQVAQEKTNPPPWKPKIAKQIEHMYAEEDAGRPFPIIDHCFPTGMPSWMLITHNAFEMLFTPGRVTILGEGDGNRMRRIYTDGRPHPPDPDPSFHGHSIGHWESGTLVVDTVAVLPQVYLAVNEAVGVPNNGDMHIVEHLHLLDPDTLADDLEITRGQVAVQTLAHHAQVLSAAGAEIRHRRRRLRRRAPSPMPSTRTATRFSRRSNSTMAFPWGRIRNETCRCSEAALDGVIAGGGARPRRGPRGTSFLRHVRAAPRP